MTNRIAGIIHKADHIVFLGFAYHDQNMLLLEPPKKVETSKRIFGTAFGMSESDVNVTSYQIAPWFTKGNVLGYRETMIKIENKLKSAELFDHYAKSLTG